MSMHELLELIELQTAQNPNRQSITEADKNSNRPEVKLLLHLVSIVAHLLCSDNQFVPADCTAELFAFQIQPMRYYIRASPYNSMSITKGGAVPSSRRVAE